MKDQIKSSAVPVYMVGLVWLIYAAVLPLYTAVHYVLCAGLSLMAFVLGKAVFPDKVISSPASAAGKETSSAPAKEQSGGTNPEVQALQAERSRALSELRRLNAAIPDPKISAQIDHLEEVTGRIIDQVIAQPAKKSQISRFLDYFLPTTIKLLNAYDRMASTGVSGSNIDTTKAKVEQMLDTLCAAFDKQLDALFGDEALDISTDITVMENLLAQEGLSSGQSGSDLQL